MKLTPQKYDISHHNSVNKASSYKPSFKGWKANAGDMMGFIERKGFFTEFLIIDSLSMIAPRILIGLNRDRKDTKERKGTGKWNLKAGAEEALRELLSGPSMFLIPLGIVAAAKKIASASKIPSHTMKALSETMSSVVDGLKDTKLYKDAKELRKNIAGKIFDNVYENAKFEDKADFKAKFIEHLTTDKPNPKKKWFGASEATNAEKFETFVQYINNKNQTKYPSETRMLSDGKNLAERAKSLYEDFENFSNDVVHKFVNNDFTTKTPKAFMDDIQKSTKRLRTAASVTSFAAVGAFLFYLPKIYQLSKLSPAEESARRARKSVQEGGQNASK